MCNIYKKTKGLFVDLIVNDSLTNPVDTQYTRSAFHDIVATADSSGLDFVARSKSYHCANIYKFKDCGHYKEVGHKEVRNSSHICQECVQDSFICTVESSGFLYLCKAPSTVAGTTMEWVMCGSCNHTFIAGRKALLRHKYVCLSCRETRQHQRALSVGVEILERQGSSELLVKFIACGHSKTVDSRDLLKIGPRSCTTCLTNAAIAEASVTGLEYIGPVSGQHHKYKTPCGHFINRSRSSVREGIWKCSVCDTGSRKQTSYIYIFQMHSGNKTWCKLGYGKSPSARLKFFGLTSDVEYTLVRKFEFSKGKIAEYVERLLHRKYKKFKLDSGEMRKYITLSGFTETYPTTFIDSFIEELEIVSEIQDETLLSYFKGVDDE